MEEKINYTEEKKYLRMTLNERVQHFLLLSSFITLVITGFALKFPEALWVRWFRDVFGSNAFEFRSDLHRIAAVIMVAVSFYHLGYISFTQRGRKLVSDLWFRKSDITDLTQTFKYFTGKKKDRPKFRRFSYIEKMEYWAVVWGTVVMGITGSLLWFENTFLPIISNSGMDIATAIHYYEAILASLAILVWHFYFVIYNPDVYPMNKAWFTGYLTEEEMEKEHPLELEKILTDEDDDSVKFVKINTEVDETTGVQKIQNKKTKNKKTGKAKKNKPE
jgi:formate dehydrogenase gamma subunit